MSEPTLSRVQIAPFADVTFRANVADAPDLVVTPGRTMRVDALEIRYYFDFSARCWMHTVRVMGRWTSRDGTPGRAAANAAYGHGDAGMPPWLMRVVTQNRPSAILPPLGARNR